MRSNGIFPAYYMKNADQRIFYVWSDAEGCSLEIAQTTKFGGFQAWPRRQLLSDKSGKAMISIVLEEKMNIIDSTCSRLHNLMIVTAHHRVGALLTAHP